MLSVMYVAERYIGRHTRLFIQEANCFSVLRSAKRFGEINILLEISMRTGKAVKVLTEKY